MKPNIILTLLTILGLTFGCDKPKTETETRTDTTITTRDETKENKLFSLTNFDVIRIDSFEYSSQMEDNARFLMDTSFVKFGKSTLTFKLDDGHRISLSDSLPTDETESFHYHYIGIYTPSNFICVIKEKYEDRDALIINKHDGNITKVWNKPVANKKGDLFFANRTIISLCGMMSHLDFNYGRQATQT